MNVKPFDQGTEINDKKEKYRWLQKHNYKIYLLKPKDLKYLYPYQDLKNLCSYKDLSRYEELFQE